MDAHAQQEIRDYATAIFNLVKPLVPITMEAFMDFRVNAMQLTGPEIEALNSGKEIESPGERREFEEKLRRLKIKCPEWEYLTQLCLVEYTLPSTLYVIKTPEEWKKTRFI